MEDSFELDDTIFLEIAEGWISPASGGGSPTSSESDEHFADELKFALEIVAEWSSDSNEADTTFAPPKCKRTPLPSEPIASPDTSDSLLSFRTGALQPPHTKAQIRLERNRRLAAESRVRKKKYVASLESQVRALTERVAALTAENELLLADQNEELRNTPKRQRMNSTGSTPLFLAAFLFTFFVNPAISASGGAQLRTVGSSASASVSAAEFELYPAYDFLDSSDFSPSTSVFDAASAAAGIFTAASAAPATRSFTAAAKGGSECRAGGAAMTGDSFSFATAAPSAAGAMTTMGGAPRFARVRRLGSRE